MTTPTERARHYLRRMASDLALIGPAQRDIEREGRMVKQGIVARLEDAANVLTAVRELYDGGEAATDARQGRLE